MRIFYIPLDLLPTYANIIIIEEDIQEEKMTAVQTLRPDAKGRVCLGAFAAGVSSFKATWDDVSGKIILEPYAEVPLQEKWLFLNSQALQSVQAGLKQSAAGNIEYIGSFASYADEEDDGN